MRISDWSSDVCSSDLTASGSYDDATQVLTIETDLGELEIQMSGSGAGDYTYTAKPAVEHGPEDSPTDDVVSDSFTYVVVDGDGDTAAANLVIDIVDGEPAAVDDVARSEEHTSELQSLMRISYAVFCL